MRKDVQELIDMAQENIIVAERSVNEIYGAYYAAMAIAESLQAMVKMFASDYERSFLGEGDQGASGS